MKNFDWCAYTYRHRRAFKYIADKLIKDEKIKQEMFKRAKVHDMDKLVMYMFLDQYTSQRQHVLTKSHHLEYSGEHTYMDMLETVIDYECSPYTKPDKPLNAYDFANKLLEKELISVDVHRQLLDIMHELDIDSSYEVTDDVEGMAYMQSIGDITEEMILLEVMQYINENECPELEFIKQSLPPSNDVR